MASGSGRIVSVTRSASRTAPARPVDAAGAGPVGAPPAELTVGDGAPVGQRVRVVQILTPSAERTRLRRPDDQAVTHYQRCGLPFFVEPGPPQVDAAFGVPVRITRLVREPGEEFTSGLEGVRVNLLTAGQGPGITPGVLLGHQDRDKCTVHPGGLAVVAQKRLRMILDDDFPVIALHHKRKTGHDAQDLGLGPQPEVPSELGELLLRQFVAQVQRQHEFKDVSHRRTR